jgi:hypothetical protein
MDARGLALAGADGSQVTGAMGLVRPPRQRHRRGKLALTALRFNPRWQDQSGYVGVDREPGAGCAVLSAVVISPWINRLVFTSS